MTLCTPGCLHQNVFFPLAQLFSDLLWTLLCVDASHQSLETQCGHVHMEVWNINGLVEAPSYKMASPRINQPHVPLIGPGNYVELFICMYLETWFIIQRPTSYFRRFYTYQQADRISNSTWKWNFSTTGIGPRWILPLWVWGWMCMVYILHTHYRIVRIDRCYYCISKIRTESGHRDFTIPLYVHTVRVYGVYVLYTVYIYIYMIIHVSACIHGYMQIQRHSYNNRMSHI